ncbi:MAG: chemotaxis protein CheW [Gammaproteobacteria bacterium]
MGDRISLVEFQKRLTARLQSTAHTERGRSALSIQAGEEHWECDLLDISEVLPVPALVVVPNTKPWFRGLAHVRGIFYSVVDLAAFRTQTSITPITLESRIILASPGLTVPFGLLVSRVLGLQRFVDIRGNAVQGDQSPRHAEERVDEGGVVWRTIDMTRLAGDPEFFQAANRSDCACSGSNGIKGPLLDPVGSSLVQANNYEC